MLKKVFMAVINWGWIRRRPKKKNKNKKNRERVSLRSFTVLITEHHHMIRFLKKKKKINL